MHRECVRVCISVRAVEGAIYRIHCWRDLHTAKLTPPHETNNEQYVRLLRSKRPHALATLLGGQAPWGPAGWLVSLQPGGKSGGRWRGEVAGTINLSRKRPHRPLTDTVVP